MTEAGKGARVAIGLSFLLFIGGMIGVNLLTPDKAFSDTENRVLERRPTFSLASLLSGAYMTDYEQYVSDQFPFRDGWIGMKTDADRALGKRESQGVYLAEDGYLIQSFTTPEEVDNDERLQAIKSFHQATPGLRKAVLLAPTAASVLQEKLPPYAPVGDERAALDQFRQRLEWNQPELRFIDVYPALDGMREETVYYRTDHHWTTQAAYNAYLVWCEQMWIVPVDEAAFNIEQVTDAFYGSLYSKSGYRHLQPDRIDLYLPKEERRIKVEYVDEGRTTDTLYELDHLDKKDKYAVFLNGNHGLIRITTDAPGGRKLLVVKDSYANSMIPFMTAHFTEIDVVDLRYYEESLMALTEERGYHGMLILYNVRTFFEDAFILNLSE